MLNLRLPIIYCCWWI